MERRFCVSTEMVEHLVMHGATFTCYCGHAISGVPRLPKRCPKCGAEIPRPTMCVWLGDLPHRPPHGRREEGA